MPLLEDVIDNPRYRPLERIGGGGMADVYLVEHTALGRRMALKILRDSLAAHAEATQFADRMRIEAQAGARLMHPNVVAVTDFWVTRHGRPCIVMEYLRGQTLAERLTERGRFGVEQAVAHATELASALSAAHALGIVHRDVKPENLFLDQTGRKQPVLKVLDFGVARILRQESRRTPEPLQSPTRSGVVIGTPYFMSPEAARGERVDERADVYAAGLCLYMMLVGHGPETLLALRTGPLGEAEPPSRHRAGVSAELDRVTLCAIRTNPGERYQSAEALLGELTRLEPRRRSRFV